MALAAVVYVITMKVLTYYQHLFTMTQESITASIFKTLTILHVFLTLNSHTQLSDNCSNELAVIFQNYLTLKLENISVLIHCLNIII